MRNPKLREVKSCAQGHTANSRSIPSPGFFLVPSGWDASEAQPLWLGHVHSPVSPPQLCILLPPPLLTRGQGGQRVGTSPRDYSNTILNAHSQAHGGRSHPQPLTDAHGHTHTQTRSQRHFLYTCLKVILTQALETRIRVATKTVTLWPLSPKPGIPRPGLFQQVCTRRVPQAWARHPLHPRCILKPPGALWVPDPLAGEKPK